MDGVLRVTSGRESAWIHARATTGLVVSATFLYRFVGDGSTAGSLRSKSVCEVFLLRFVAIARHGNVFSGGNEGERW